jgi:hypothetical protein
MGRWEPVRLLHLHNVRLWQVANMPMALGDVRFRGLLGQVWQKRNSGKGLMRVPASQKWPWEAHGKQVWEAGLTRHDTVGASVARSDDRTQSARAWGP